MNIRMPEFLCFTKQILNNINMMMFKVLGPRSRTEKRNDEKEKTTRCLLVGLNFFRVGAIVMQLIPHSV